MRGHIKERSPGHWAIVLAVRDPVTGKSKRRWHSVKGGKRAAQVERARLIAEIASGGYVEPSKQTFEQYFAEWLRDWVPMKAGPKTIETYAHWGRHLVAAIGAKPLQQIRGGDLNRAYREARANGLSDRSVRHLHKLARRVFGHALRQGDVRRDPSREIDAPTAAPTEAAILHPEQVPVMLEALRGTTLYPIAMLALGTGMRRGELCALRWRNVDLQVGKLEVKESLEQTHKGGLRFKGPKTQHGRRTISLARSVVACLQKHHTSQLEQRMKLGLGKPPADALVFATYDGRPHSPDTLTNRFSAALAAAGLPHVTLHTLRHTHASMLLASGMDILTISRRLGHSSAGITLNVYGHLFTSKDGAADAVEALLGDIS
jgi:integrase